MDAVGSLRGKMYKKLKPKRLRGQIINGPMLIELAESYSHALNKGGVPTIDTAWNYMQASELERAFKEAISELDKKLKQEVEPNLPMSED